MSERLGKKVFAGAMDVIGTIHLLALTIEEKYGFRFYECTDGRELKNRVLILLDAEPEKIMGQVVVLDYPNLIRHYCQLTLYDHNGGFEYTDNLLLRWQIITECIDHAIQERERSITSNEYQPNLEGHSETLSLLIEFRNQLSDKQVKVFEGILARKTYQEIAKELFIAEPTVKHHASGMFDKASGFFKCPISDQVSLLQAFLPKLPS